MTSSADGFWSHAPRLTQVSFEPDDTELSEAARESLEELAGRVARDGLRSRSRDLPLPFVILTGYGEGTDEEAEAEGEERATNAYVEFLASLDVELSRRQKKVPPDQQLTAHDFTIEWGSSGGDVGQSADAEALRRRVTVEVVSPMTLLNDLRKADPELRDAPLDMDALIRRVLHRAANTPVGPSERERAAGLIVDAYKGGWTDSLGALGAYHAFEKGVISSRRERYFTVGGHRAAGINWSPEKVISLDTTKVDILRKRPDGGFDTDGWGHAPWGTGQFPYAVVAEGGHDRVTATWPDGTARALTVDEFVELVARDLELTGAPPGTPIVLVIPQGGDRGLDLPQKLADRTGLTVWAHSGDVTIHDIGSQTYSIGVIHHDGRIEGDWVPSLPGMAPGVAADGPSWWRKVVNRTLVGLTGRRIGRTAIRPEEVAKKQMEAQQRHLDAMKHYAHYNVAAQRVVSGLLPLPRPGKPGTRRYYFDAHGGPGYIVFPLEDGKHVHARNEDGARYIARRRSVRELDKDDWIELVLCYAGSPQDHGVDSANRRDTGDSFPGSFVPDPLAEVAVGQHVANEARHKVNCTVLLDATALHHGEYIRYLTTDAQGRRGSYEQFFPEPDEEELDRRAREIGYHSGPGPAPDVARAATLRLVRALRLTLGKEIDDDVRIDQDPEYAELLRGVAELSRMWLSDARFGNAGLFTLDFFERVVAATLPAGTRVRQADYRNVLKAAAAAVDGTKLSDFATLPSSLDDAAQWLDTADVVGEAVRALRLRGPDEVRTRQRSRMFWARVKMLEAWDASAFEGITAHLYDLPSADLVTDWQRDFIRDLITRAFAGGLDGSDADVMVAFLLDRKGALSKTTALPVPGAPGTVSGRDFLGTLNGTAPDLSKVRTPSGPVDAPWAGKDKQTGEDKPVPYTVHAKVDPKAPGRVLVTFESSPGHPLTRSLSPQEFAELLARDAHLSYEDLTIPILLDIKGLVAHAPDLIKTVAQRLGRRIWVIGEPAPTDPVDPQNPEPAPSPVRPPAPRRADRGFDSESGTDVDSVFAGRGLTVRFDPGSAMVSEDDVADIEDKKK
ncbi:lonely Cys domain-containing protein [Streptomyces himastatinicus]|uniref:lonely Cys domain-containing protein n=1 Tax=Streptomyces himastatinicus TaxID=998084 RepID=UPI00142F2D20|nr:lonely Cys domain-containing protein [Streptomyces himastatinicus]